METSSVQNNECTADGSSSFVESSVLSDTLSEGNQYSDLRQSMSILTVDDYSDPRFQVPVDTVRFYPDRKDKLFKITVKSHKNIETKISYSSWRPQFDQWVWLRSIWAYAQFSSLLSNKKRFHVI